MKKNIKLETVANIVLIVTGVIYVLLPWFANVETLDLFYLVLGLLSGLRLIEYIFQKDKKDHENLFVSLVSILIPMLSLLKFPNQQMLLPLSILTWVGLMAIVKLIKLDYLHDRGLPFFKFKLYGFILFIIIGVLTTYSLHFDNSVQNVILGFFIIIITVLDLFKDHIEAYLEKPTKPKTQTKKAKKNT